MLRIHKTYNLRMLQHAIWDFEHLAISFTDEHWSSKNAIDAIFRVVVALSYEARSGRISQAEVPDLPGNRIARSIRARRGAEETNVDKVAARYPEVNFDQKVLNSEILADLLFRGWVDTVAVVKDLDSSSYFTDSSSEPAWRTALQVWYFDDQKSEQACDTLEAQFAAREFDIPGELFQVFGTLLFLSEVRVISKSEAVVKEECIAYIDDLRVKKRIRYKYLEESKIDSSRGWGGYTFAGADTSEFGTIAKYYMTVVDDVADEMLPSEAARILKTMAEDPVKFSHTISRNAGERGLYLDVPILKFLRPDEFVNVLLSVRPEHLDEIFIALSVRYDGIASNVELNGELAWLKELYSTLQAKLGTLGPISQFRIRNLIAQYIEPNIQKAAVNDAERSEAARGVGPEGMSNIADK